MNIVDQIAQNAKVLAKLAKAVDKAERRHWNIGPHDEFKVQRYYEVKREQEKLLDQLRKGRSSMT